MKYYISGAAGRAASFKNGEWEFITTENYSEPIKLLNRELHHLFNGVSDIDEVDCDTDFSAFKELEIRWRTEQLIHLFKIILDEPEGSELSAEALSCLIDCVDNEKIMTGFWGHLYFLPYSNLRVESISRFGRLSEEVREILSGQEYIRVLHEGWLANIEELNRDVYQAHSIARSFQRSGIPRQLIGAIRSGDYGLPTIELQLFMKAIPNGRIFSSSLIKSLKSNGNKSGKAIRKTPPSESEPQRDSIVQGYYLNDQFKGQKPSGHGKYQSVKNQKGEIERLISLGEWDKAELFLRELVARQLAEGDREFAAMTLCSISQVAKIYENIPLYSQLAFWAADIAPADPRATGQAADACLYAQDFIQAESWLAKTAENGDQRYEKIGKARILRLKGDPEGALKIFEQLAEEYSGDYHVLVNFAETLRDLSRYEVALGIYAKVLNQFPYDRFAMLQSALISREMGRMESAANFYDDVVSIHGWTPDVISGQAHLHRDMGKFPEAIRLFSKATSEFPLSDQLEVGLGSVYKEAGDFPNALVHFSKAIKLNSFSAVAANGHANTLRELGKFTEAKSEFNEIIAKFSFDPVAYCGRAAMEKQSGNLTTALQFYDDALQRFPKNRFAINGRSNTLKELGFLPEARQAFERALKNSPHDNNTRIGLSSVLVAIGDFSQLNSIIPIIRRPSTKFEWHAEYIRGMMHLKTQEFSAAEKILSMGLESPFHSMKRLFLRGLGLFQLRRRNFDASIARLSKNDDAISKVLMMHAYAGKGDLAQVRGNYNLIAEYCPENIIPLRDALASKYRLKVVPEPRDWTWIERRELEMVLLAA